MLTAVLMANEGFFFAESAEALRAYNEHAERERIAAATAIRADKHEIASAHRLLAIQYEADAEELRRKLAKA